MIELATPSTALDGSSALAGTLRRATGESFASVDPRTGTASGWELPGASAADIATACVAADEAFEVLRGWTPDQIATLLDRLADAVTDAAADLAATADRETGLGVEALGREIQRTTFQLQRFAALVRSGDAADARIDLPAADWVPGPRPDVRRRQIAIGPVAVFAASNVPFAFGVLGGDTASALAAGCPVVVKAHPSQPATGESLARLASAVVAEVGAPAGTFSLVHGASGDVGRWLVEDPRIEAVGFTGSAAGGRALYDLAARRDRPIPVFAEMGSVNPTFVTAGALAERGGAIAEQLAGAVTVGWGQFCTKPGIVVLPAGAAATEFTDALVANLGARPDGVLLGPHIARRLRERLDRSCHTAGVETLLDGGPSGDGCVAGPAVLSVPASTLLDEPALFEEHFGPAVVVVSAADADEMAAVAAAAPNSLAAAVFAETSEHDVAARLCSVLERKVGRLVMNAVPTGVAVSAAMQHGGPYPATTAPWSTSVGSASIERFLRPVAYQGFADDLLPEVLRDANPLVARRLVNDEWTTEAIRRG